MTSLCSARHLGAALLAVLAAGAALIAGCAATGSASPPVAEVPPQYPMRDFFRNIDRGYFRLSSDGRMLGFMQPAAGEDGKARRMNIFVQPLDGSRPVGEPRQVTRESARDIPNYFWKGPGTLLYTKDFGGDENFHVVAVDAASGKVTDLTPYEGVRADIVDDLVDDPEHILVQHNRRDRRAFDVYRVNVKTGAEALVALNPGNVVAWQADHAGRVRIGVVSDGVDNTLVYRSTEGEPFRPIISTDFRTQVTPQFFDFANRSFYATSNRGRDRAALVLIDPARPDAETVVYEHPRVDIDGASFSRERRVLSLASFQEEKPGRAYFDAATRALYERIEARLPGYTIILQSNTLGEDKFIVAATNDRSPGSRYVYDATADSLAKLGDIAPWLPEQHMAPMQPIRYRARDGLEIPGYLTLPVGRPAKDLACIVNPHGGPWARDGWGFNPEVQFLANRGYCVLQMNFRGSTGYRPPPHRHLRRQLWRLRDPGRGHDDARPVCGGGQLRRREQPVHVHEHHPAVLGAAAAADVRDGRQPRRPGRPGAHDGHLAGAERGRDHHAAAGGPGRARPAGEQGRERPGGRGAAPARHRRAVHRQGRRGPRLRQRGEPLRVLRGDGGLPGPSPAAAVTPGGCPQFTSARDVKASAKNWSSGRPHRAKSRRAASTITGAPQA